MASAMPTPVRRSGRSTRRPALGARHHLVRDAVLVVVAAVVIAIIVAGNISTTATRSTTLAPFDATNASVAAVVATAINAASPGMTGTPSVQARCERDTRRSWP